MQETENKSFHYFKMEPVFMYFENYFQDIDIKKLV